MIQGNWSFFVCKDTHPDSVNLVRPPNTTIPKTLAALPMSQYATPLGFVLAKAVFVFVFVLATF